MKTKLLRAAQDASHNPAAKAKRIAKWLGRAPGGVFQQEPPEMRLDDFFGSARLNCDEASDIGNVVL
jgi:hypothetical protein